MNKITTKAQARELVGAMLKNNNLEIQLFDGVNGNEIISLIPDSELSYKCEMIWKDTVAGEGGKASMTIVGVVDMIFNHRKFINKSGQLASV